MKCTARAGYSARIAGLWDIADFVDMAEYGDVADSVPSELLIVIELLSNCIIHLNYGKKFNLLLLHCYIFYNCIIAKH